MVINLRIDNDALSVLNPSSIVSGSKNYYCLNAVFTADWDGLSRYVIFPDYDCSINMDDEGSAVLPESLISKSGILTFGLIGKDAEGNLRISTNYVRLRILEGASEADALPPLPDEGSAWEGYIAEVTEEYISAEGVVKNNAASVTNGRIAVFDGTTGKIIKDGGKTVAQLAPLASPAFTGTPKATTAASGTSSTQIATTEFVQNALSGYIVGGTGENGVTWGYIPVVKNDGGIELGQYIDLHLTSGDNIDRYVRLRIYAGDPPTFQVEGSEYGALANIVGNHIHGQEIHSESGFFGKLGYPLKLTLNGTTFEYALTSDSASSFADGVVFYAPKTSGTANQILLAGADGAPVWADNAPLATAFKSGSTTISFAQFYAAFTTAVTALQSAVNEVKEDAHTHDNKTVLDEITSVKVAGWNKAAEASSNHISYQGETTDIYSIHDFKSGYMYFDAEKSTLWIANRDSSEYYDGVLNWGVIETDGSVMPEETKTALRDFFFRSIDLGIKTDSNHRSGYLAFFADDTGEILTDGGTDGISIGNVALKSEVNALLSRIAALEAQLNG